MKTTPGLSHEKAMTPVIAANCPRDEIDRRLLPLALDFTCRYRETDGWPAARREIACMATTLPGTLCMPLDDDLFAGRVVMPIAGFSNQYWFEATNDDTVGYYFDESRATRVLKEQELDGTELGEAIREAALFWREENSEAKIDQALDADMRRALPSKFFARDSAAAHRLYRIASTGQDFAYLLTTGLPALERTFRQEAAWLQDRDPAGAAWVGGCADYLKLVRAVLAQYAEALSRATAEQSDARRRAQLNRMAQSMAALDKRPPQTFYEAIQLTHLFCVCGYFVNSFGRMDDYLGPYLEQDLEKGELTDEEAIELLISYWALINEHCRNSRLTLGGKGRRHPRAADLFTSVALEATRRFYARFTPRQKHIRQTLSICPQVALRLSRETPQDLPDLALDVIADGSTFPLLYHDEVNIPAVSRAFRIPGELAEQYSFFDCGEYVIDQHSIGTPSAIINLPKALEATLHDGIDPKTGRRIGPATGSADTITDFETLWERYAQQVAFATRQCAKFQKRVFEVLNRDTAFVAMHMLQPESRRVHRGMLDGGCAMLGGTFETYGNITTADSLYVIQKLVFERRACTLSTLLTAMRENFKGHEELHRKILALPKFGNDHDGVDAMAARVHDHICDCTRAQGDRVGLHHYLVVVINNGANVTLGHHVGATPDGRLEGEAVTNGLTPTPGRDRNGITALLNSIVKLSPDCHAGAVHNLRFSRATMRQRRQAVKTLLAAYFAQGGTQCMITVTSREELLEAQKHPEAYGHLLVRLGGFSARFVDLPPDMQKEIIERNAY